MATGLPHRPLHSWCCNNIIVDKVGIRALRLGTGADLTLGEWAYTTT